jgi:hypothetical protein
MKDEAYYRMLLARSFDEELDRPEAEALKEELIRSGTLRKEAAQLRKLRQALESLPKPSDETFTDGVMRRIGTVAEHHLSIRWLNWAAAASAAIILMAGLSIYWSAGSLSTEALVGISELAPEDALTLLQAY